MLEAKKLSKSFGDHTALHALDLNVGPGEVLCLLGANGAGKTTTINLFLGFLEPTSGEALINNINVHDFPIETKRSLAYIPEQVALYPLLTGMENLQHFAELAGQPRYSTSELHRFLDSAGLDIRFANKRVSEYSKGMRQKVGVAIALAKNASIFLLDEPLSGLDPKAANEFTQLIGQLKEQGASILMATHDIFRARDVATQIGIMKSGHLVETLAPSSLHEKELEGIYLAHMRELDASTRESA